MNEFNKLIQQKNDEIEDLKRKQEEQMARYLIMQIGCIECGVSSYPIKIVETLEEAEKVSENHPSTWDSEGGDGFVMIIDLHTCKEVGICNKVHCAGY